MWSTSKPTKHSVIFALSRDCAIIARFGGEKFPVGGLRADDRFGVGLRSSAAASGATAGAMSSGVNVRARKRSSPLSLWALSRSLAASRALVFGSSMRWAEFQSSKESRYDWYSVDSLDSSR